MKAWCYLDGLKEVIVETFPEVFSSEFKEAWRSLDLEIPYKDCTLGLYVGEMASNDSVIKVIKDMRRVMTRLEVTFKWDVKYLGIMKAIYTKILKSYYLDTVEILKLLCSYEYMKELIVYCDSKDDIFYSATKREELVKEPILYMGKYIRDVAGLPAGCVFDEFMKTAGIEYI